MDEGAEEAFWEGEIEEKEEEEEKRKRWTVYLCGCVWTRCMYVQCTVGLLQDTRTDFCCTVVYAAL